MLTASMLPRPALSPMPLHARVAAMTSLAAGAAQDGWRDGVPNALTASRIVAVPLLACAFYWQRTRAARVPAAIFLACALTDWLDGFLARRWAVDTDLGAFLDPVADKLLVCTCLALLSDRFILFATSRKNLPGGRRKILCSSLLSNKNPPLRGGTDGRGRPRRTGALSHRTL